MKGQAIPCMPGCRGEFGVAVVLVSLSPTVATAELDCLSLVAACVLPISVFLMGRHGEITVPDVFSFTSSNLECNCIS